MTMKKIAKIIAIVFCFCMILGIILYAFRPYSSYVTIEKIETITNTNLFIKANDTYYELQGNSDFVKLFQFEEWQYTQKTTENVPRIIFSFGEEWILELYESSQTKT